MDSNGSKSAERSDEDAQYACAKETYAVGIALNVVRRTIVPISTGVPECLTKDEAG